MNKASDPPLISLVIPTRDRPEFASLALQSVCAQSFRDFEVILSDNALTRPFVPDPRIFDGRRVRYVRPPKPVWMTDHWEFAVQQARGRYVGVIGDKSVLFSNALEQVACEIARESPDVVSWRVGNFAPAGRDIAGAGTVTFKRASGRDAEKVEAADVLNYLLATYLDADFAADHQLEIRGSIYHGVFSASLLEAMRRRYGRVFRFYAPDLNSQCAAMQIAREVTCIGRPLELAVAGPSNGVLVGRRASHMLDTQEEAARGGSGASPRLIPGVSASIAHLLASDLVAISGRTLSGAQHRELHAKAAFDLYSLAGWPTRSSRRSQMVALHSSAARMGAETERRVRLAKWNARRGLARERVVDYLRAAAGTQLGRLRRALGAEDQSVDRRPFEDLRAALNARSETRGDQ
jgi:hypothetical protein